MENRAEVQVRPRKMGQTLNSLERDQADSALESGC